MNRFPAPLRWRHLRWALCAAVVPALWACNTRKLKAPDGTPSQVVQDKILQTQNRKLDLLFMVDDSTSMKPLQAKMAQRLPDFMNALKDQATGALPDLHVAVITSSLGAGIYNNVPGCEPGPPGDDGGKFQHKAGCGLNTGATYIKASPDGSTNNFTGQIQDVFSCIALVGDGGCGFEHQFESMRQAILRASDPNDPDNGGFLRDDAVLGIVMLTNEDDCSVPGESQLFNPDVQSVNDQPPLGGLWSYRCNEFGHKCDQPFPHTAAGLPMTMTNCVSKENTDGMYHLTPVADFVKFLGVVKPKESLLLAIIGGPYDDATPAKYIVKSRVAQLTTGSTEMQPEISHSCMSPAGDYADPGVRLLQLVKAVDGVFLPICAADFTPAMTQIAQSIIKKLQVQCVKGNIVETSPGVPDCDVVLRTSSPAKVDDKLLKNCAVGGPGTIDMPCWQWGADTDNKCPGAKVLQLCYGAGCAPAPMNGNSTAALVSCALVGP